MPCLLPQIEEWSQWAAIIDDLATWRPVIDAICEQEGIQYQSIEIPRSNTNAVFILDRRRVLKVYSPFWSEFSLERSLLETLGATGSVPVPSILTSGQLQDRTLWDYLVLEYRRAVPFGDIRMNGDQGDALEIAAKMGRLIKALHHIDPRRISGLDSTESWHQLIERRRSEAPYELIDRNIVSRSIIDDLTGLLDEAIEWPKSHRPVIVHGDLESDHVLLTKELDRWRIDAIIDWGDAKVGVPDYEWMPLWLGLFNRDVHLMRAFLEAYDARLLNDDRLPRRALAWTILHDFGTDAITELIVETGETMPIDDLERLQELLCSEALLLQQ